MKIRIPVSTFCTCLALVIMFPVTEAIYSIKFWVVFVLLSTATFLSHYEGKKAAKDENDKRST